MMPAIPPPPPGRIVRDGYVPKLQPAPVNAVEPEYESIWPSWTTIAFVGMLGSMLFGCAQTPPAEAPKPKPQACSMKVMGEGPDETFFVLMACEELK